MAGVFISDGMRLRIPAGGLTLSIGDDGAIESVARFEVMLDVWPFWLDVAIDQAVNAVGARKELEKSAATTGTESLEADQGDLLAQECKAGMVSIAAAAFALDSFYAGVKPFAPAGEGLQKGFRKADTPRHGRISETLRRSFHVPDKQARQLHQSVEEIFKYRDWAVHDPIMPNPKMSRKAWSRAPSEAGSA